MRLRKLLPLFIVFLLPFLGKAQVTTSTITGTITTPEGTPLGGASVKIVHQPTGSVYRTISHNDGLYTLPNIKVGGPYILTVEYVGYNSKEIKDLTATLGTPLIVDIRLDSTVSGDLKDVNVEASGRGALISSQRMGTATILSSRTIQELPSINRNIQDYARLMPQAKSASAAATGNGVGVSFGGQNNRYNQFSIDGANANDGFGLSSNGSNGGQANINPISMEAIQEFQIVMSPYDVTQGGFTGGGINAVTKSGTNEFHGAVYGQFQGRNFIGKSVPYNSTVTRNGLYQGYSNNTFGASVGGPIIKNKLFFYVNYERFERETPLTFDPTIAGSGSKVNADTLESIRKFLMTNYNYDPGSYGAISNKNASNSVFAKIDWNIDDKNKLMLRFNHVDGYLDVLSRSATSAVFANSGYRFNDKNNSIVAELNSNFSSGLSNVLRLTYSAINDYRTTSAFPNVSITNYDAAQQASISYAIGSEYSSAVNGLTQKVFTLTDNLTLYKGAHTITIGTNNEFFNSNNLFLQGYYGAYTYNLGSNSTNNITNFMSNTGMTAYSVGFSTSSDPNDKAAAKVHAAQFSVYGGDVWAINPRFKLTYGLRIDLPTFFNKPLENSKFDSAFSSYGVATNQMPKVSPLFSPRIGFNWDVNGDKTTQLRGGAGIFTGRVPFVWISNNISGSGLLSSSYSPPTSSGNTPDQNAAIIKAAGIHFPNSASDLTGPHLGAQNTTTSTATPTINVVNKNFKYPQVFRTNLAIDQKLPLGLIGTVEGVYTKTLNNAFYSNLNQSANGDTITTIGGINRPYWRTTNANRSYLQVLELSNTSKGQSYTFTVQIQKPLSQGWSGSIAYTYGHSTSINDLTSSVAASNWKSPLTVNGLNKPDLATSNFNLGSRVVGFVSKQFDYAKYFSTTLTLVYTGQTGQYFSYTAGNLNGDGGTSLAYLPKSFADANFVDIKNGETAAQQWTDYQEFQKDNDYLLKHAGQNAERNGTHMPFESHFDFRIAQDFKLGKAKLQVFYDVLNIANLLNKNWGWSYSSISATADGFYTASSNIFTMTTVSSKVPQYTQTAPDGTVTTLKPGVTNPAFTFNKGNFTDIKGKLRPYQVSDFTSRWSSQIGVRLSF